MKDTSIHSAGGVVINTHGKVLVVNQNNDSWSLPKGHIEKGEDALTAATREIAEESGIPQNRLTLIRPLGTYERSTLALGGVFHPTGTRMKTITMFLFTTDWVDPLFPTDLDNPEARWVAPEDVTALLTHPKDKDFFSSLRGLDKITKSV